MKKYFILFAVVLLSACASDADVASRNLSVEADNFNLVRRIVFYNGHTGEYMLSIEGRCSIKADGADKQLEVTCRTGEDEYKKHFLGLSDNVTYFVEQLGGAKVGTFHQKIIFKPEAILADIDLQIEE